MPLRKTLKSLKYSIFAALPFVLVLSAAYAQQTAQASDDMSGLGLQTAGSDTVARAGTQPTGQQPVAPTAQPVDSVQQSTAGTTGQPVVDPSVQSGQLSPQQMQQQAHAVISEIDMTAQSVHAMLRKAREERDAVKTVCLDDKLTQIEVARRSAGERVDSLDQAVAQNDQELIAHDHTIMMVMRERVALLAAEANQCIGVVEGFVGESSISVDVDPNIPPGDISTFPRIPDIVLPPVCVSCVQ